MSFPRIVSEDEWLVERTRLLEDEKELTRARDALNSRRRELPMVRVEKDYVFGAPSGDVSLLDMFEGSSQLIVQHFMFDPSWEDGCPSCSSSADEVSDGIRQHLASRGTVFVCVSRARIEQIERYKETRGWTFPWYSSFGNDFNYDFHVTIDSSKTPVMWNYRTPAELERVGMGWLLEGSWEQSGLSMFLRDGDSIFHTYSTFARGAEAQGGTYYYLDMTALGRQEEWELPLGRASHPRAAVPDFSE